MIPDRGIPRPGQRPADPRFSSGPARKRPGWTPEALADAALGRSHRSALGKSKLEAAITRTHRLLDMPADYRLAIVPASDTGAVEMALWSLLGPRPVDIFAWESFGEEWVTDVVDALRLDARVHRAPYGQLPDFPAVRKDADIIFTQNGTTAGVKIPDFDWIPEDREGLAINDATSAAFAQPIDWRKCDVVTLSWQKALGGEGGHGMLALSPRAVARLETHVPDRALPKIFRLTKKGKLDEDLFQGATINTPSMLAVEDWLDALGWAESIGGLPALIMRADANAGVLHEWVARTPWVANLAVRPETASNTGLCLKIVDRRVTALSEAGQAQFAKKFAALLEKEGVALDAASYRAAPPGLRIWCGATVERADIEALLPWLDWAFATLAAESEAV